MDKEHLAREVKPVACRAMCGRRGTRLASSSGVGVSAWNPSPSPRGRRTHTPLMARLGVMVHRIEGYKTCALDQVHRSQRELPDAAATPYSGMRAIPLSRNPWLAFGGCVLVVAVLAHVRAVLVPIAIAVLLAFLVTPLVTLLQRRVGRLASVILVVVASTAICAGLATLGLAEIGTLAERLPSYRDNIRSKITDVRLMTEGGIVEKIEQLVVDVQGDVLASRMLALAICRRAVP